MEFIKKTELFFIQLQYCLTIEPEPILQAEKGVYNLMLKPDIFFKLINDFNIDYPFIPENKIIELKGLMSKENINTKDTLKIIENYKKQYWFLDTVVIFEPVTDKLKRTLKSIDINISEKEINIELINYQKHLQAKRESIYIDLINEMQSLPPQPIVESPFSVLEWATIFYYADETKLLTESRLIKTRLEQFMSKHQINATPVNFKNSYYEAKRRINEKNDYPINKLELIIPFLKENYKQTVTKVENDIIFLEENKREY
jgi:hypothetical protein